MPSGRDGEIRAFLTQVAQFAQTLETRKGAITSALLGDTGQVTREPLVRTLHSYAFAVLRLAAQRAGDPPPRLITSEIGRAHV